MRSTSGFCIMPRNWRAQGREGLDVPPLAFRIERVESERGFAGPRDPGDHNKLVTGDLHIDIFQVVLACTPDNDIFHGYVLSLLTPGIYSGSVRGMKVKGGKFKRLISN